MSGFDLAVAAIFIISIIVGIMRGFIKEALSITSWILAIWLGLTFCHQAGEWLGQFVTIPAESFRTWSGFALVFVGTLFLFSILSFVITKLLVQGPIKGVDRVLGIGFGMARAAAIVIVIVLVARGFGMGTSEWWQESQSMVYLEPMANYVEQLLPEQLQSSEKVEEALDSALQSVDSAAAAKKLLEAAAN